MAGQEVNGPLIGAEGQQFVSHSLGRLGPQGGIKEIQNRLGLQHPLCSALLGMVDQLGISRADAHKSVLQAARQALLTRVRELDRTPLERLLKSSFPFLGIQELREVPIAVMERLEKVPPVFLKQLAVDKEIFKELPAKVQRQVWEFDKNLLQQDALPPVGQYKYEVATIMRALAMDEFLPAVLAVRPTAPKERRQDGGSGDDEAGPSSSTSHMQPQGLTRQSSKRTTGITRKILRKGSRVLQVLKSMVGTSPKIYSMVVELCVVKYRDADGLYMGFKELSYCTLRSQLLMALHDDNHPVSEKDRCHDLAWTFDAGIMNGSLAEKHIHKLEKYFQDVEAAEQQASRQAAALQGAGKPGHVQDEAESAGNVAGSLVEPYKVLGDAGVILRDPSVMHLLAATVLQQMLQGALEGKMPREVEPLGFVLRMMQLAVDSRQMLRDRTYRFPDADPRILHDVLPMLAALMLEFETTGSPDPRELGTELGSFGLPKDVVQRAMEVLPRSEVARKLVQVFSLERLMRQDYLSAVRVLKMLAQVMAPKGITEMFDFAGALAQRLADLVKAKQLPTTSCLWVYAVDNILIKAVDSHTQVHEEVLRLLLAAANQLKADELGKYLEYTLENSKKSRKRVKKPHGDPLANFPMAIASDIGSDIGSDGWPGIAALKVKSSDGVKSVYSQFTKLRDIKLTKENAPGLHKYLAESESNPDG